MAACLSLYTSEDKRKKNPTVVEEGSAPIHACTGMGARLGPACNPLLTRVLCPHSRIIYQPTVGMHPTTGQSEACPMTFPCACAPLTLLSCSMSLWPRHFVAPTVAAAPLRTHLLATVPSSSRSIHTSKYPSHLHTVPPPQKHETLYFGQAAPPLSAHSSHYGPAGAFARPRPRLELTMHDEVLGECRPCCECCDCCCGAPRGCGVSRPRCRSSQSGLSAASSAEACWGHGDGATSPGPLGARWRPVRPAAWNVMPWPCAWRASCGARATTTTRPWAACEVGGSRQGACSCTAVIRTCVMAM